MRAFLFDMDGTLAHNFPFHLKAWTAFLADHGRPMGEDEFFAYTGGGMTNAEILRGLIRHDLEDHEVATLALRKETRYRDLYAPHRTPLPGLTDFLDAARAAGIVTGLVTSAGRDNIDFLVGGLGLLGHFDLLLSADDVRYGKPHPEPYQTAAERLGLSPAQCLAFEDAPSGIASAHAAGMAVVAVTTSLTEREALAHPGVVRAIPHYEGLTLESLP
jgi:HAD superfamily hydrolase (TIGR01509 family)